MHKGTYDADRDGNISIGHMDGTLSRATIPNNVDEQNSQRREEDNLEQGVDHDQNRPILRIASGQVNPNHDHRNAPRQTDQYHPGTVLWQVGQTSPGKPKHDERTDDPIEENGESDV